MRIQAKLFILLLVIAILPLAALSWRSERATENLGLAIAEHGKAAMVEEIESQLRQAVGYASDLMAAQQRQVELALRLQAAAVERLLAAPPPVAAVTPPIYMHSAFDDARSWPPGTELALDHAIVSAGREQQAVPISRDHQSFLMAPGAELDAAREMMRRLVTMDDVYRRLNETNPRLFYWQYTTLKEGVHSAYPGHGGYPPNYDPRQRAWYTGAAAAKDVIWTLPLLDASTRRLLLTAAMQVRGPDQSFAGVTAIDIDILGILDGSHIRLRLGDSADSFVIQLTDAQGQVYVPPAPGSATTEVRPVLRVLASSTYRDSGSSWDSAPEAPVLASGTPDGLAAIVDDLRAGRDGIRQMPHENHDSLWVYGRVAGLSSALLFVVPVDDIEVIAEEAQASVRQAIEDQVRLAGVASIALVVLVAVLSMVAARSVTEPLRELAAAAQDLAKGNLDRRVDVDGSDEVADLANAFNTMAPELQQHIQTKESMALAREVQQKLLPDEAPVVRGFDIAGVSVYSEDVGGDYYDFLDLRDDAGERRIGIAVGDVAGHGVVAALTMTSVRVLLRGYAGDGTTLKPVMRAVNRHLSADSTAGRFVTLVYLVLEPDTREVRWINAGHGPIFLYDPATRGFEDLAAQDIPLGVNPDWTFEENVREDWPASGILIIGTDGIWEAQNGEGRVFGKDGFKQVIQKNAHLPAADICKEVVRRLEEFADGEPQRDDVTLVVLKFPESPTPAAVS
jgi:sigma-B regulation protein RsbU (phosphoserine phosphatase)